MPVWQCDCYTYSICNKEQFMEEKFFHLCHNQNYENSTKTNLLDSGPQALIECHLAILISVLF